MTPVLFLPAGFLMFFGTNSLWRLFGFHAALAVAWLFVSLVVIAVGLYSLRFWSRLLYGMIELVAGAAVLLAAINTYGAAQGREYVPIVGGGLFHTRPQGILQLSGPQIALFGMLVAVYVLVRGLDNVGEGLRDHPKWNARWQRWFRPPSRS